MRRYLSIIVCFLGIALALGPVLYALQYNASLPTHVLAALNLIAWISVSLLLISQRKMLVSIDKATRELKLPKVDGDIEQKLASFLREWSRYHDAAYSFRVAERDEEGNLSLSLRHITELAYGLLGAQSVELALHDDSFEQWSQALLVGEPMNSDSQSLIVAARTDESKDKNPSTQVIAEPLAFSGTDFGVLRVELPPGCKATKSDTKVVRLLARQAAIVLVDDRFTEELMRMRQQSEESVRAKTGFLANLSHEIRGPLGIILNGIELMIDGLCGPMTDSQRETSQMVKNSGEHLLDLVNDVLDYAKVEAGKVQASPVDIQLKALVSDLANVIRSQAIAKKHKLVQPEVDPTLGISCDKRHARQMLINFLTNAVKYTPEGGTITIGVDRMPNNRVKIWVRDTGVGIPESEQSKVFGAFERVNNQYSMAQEGTGLGMPLTKRLAEVNGGGVGFESEDGEGSTFWILMPAVEVEQATAIVEEDDEAVIKVPQGQGEAILLVDHNREAREMLERYLEHQGFEILNAQCGSDVMNLLREKEIELAVVESDLPDASGEDMVQVIRSNPSASGVPIILLSSKAFVFDIERFLKLGVDRCLSKPVELSELAITVRQLIDESKDLAQ